MTTSTASLTPKQQQVVDLLEKGTSPAEIAKRLKISTSGVYGHIRNIKAAGVEVQAAGKEETSETLATAPQAAAGNSSASANGHVDPARALDAAVEGGRARLEVLAAEIEAAKLAISTFEAEAEGIEATIEKYNAALSALA